MEIKYLDHFNIRAPIEKLSEIKDFYVNVLGFKVGYRPKLSGPGQWLYAGSKPMVHLNEDENRASRKGEDSLDHIAMRCVGVDEFAATLKKHAIPYRPVYVADIDLTQLFFKDPAGVTIEVNFEGEELIKE